MIVYFFSLITAALIIICNNWRHASNRWAAFFLSCASIGGLADLLVESGFQALADVSKLLNYTLTPYGVLMFSIIYSGIYKLTTKYKRGLRLLLFLPPIATAVTAVMNPDHTLFFVLLLIWSAPYYLCSCYLLVISFWREQDIRMKRSRFITTIIIVPTLLGVLVFINIAKVISPNFDFFNYISVFIIYSLAVALLCTFLYGVLGVKLRFERDPLESTMKAVSSGAAMLNHTIKNEIGKISISADNLKSIFPDADVQSQQQLQIIANSSNHMLAMVTRIHSQMRDLMLQEEPCRIDQLVDECIMQHRGMLDKEGVKVNTTYAIRPVIWCDSVHVREAIGNVLMNACEAMTGGGVIEVHLSATKRRIELAIRDSGAGIPADMLGHVFDPFYSSGITGHNFGLGLSYVYNVMQKSGGSVAITSIVGAGGGTNVSFFWPRKKVIEGRESR